MDIAQALYKLLTEDTAGVYALVGTRIWIPVLPQPGAYPAIAYRMVSREHIGVLSERGSVGLAVSGFRFFSTTKGKTQQSYKQAMAIDEAIRLCLQGLSGEIADTASPPGESLYLQDIQPGRSSDFYDELTETTQIITDFEMWHSVPIPAALLGG